MRARRHRTSDFAGTLEILVEAAPAAARRDRRVAEALLALCLDLNTLPGRFLPPGSHRRVGGGRGPGSCPRLAQTGAPTKTSARMERM